MSNPGGGDPVPGTSGQQETTNKSSQERLIGPMTSADVLQVRASILSHDTNNPMAEQSWQNILTGTRRYLLVLTRDEHVADELTAETIEGLLIAFNKPDFNFHTDPAAYVLGIARMREKMRGRTQQLMQKRNSGSDLTEALNIVDKTEDPERSLLEREFAIQMINHLNDLTEEQRAVLKLKILDLSNDEIAEIMGKEPSTIRALAFRARDSLVRLHPQYGDLLTDKPRKSRTIPPYKRATSDKGSEGLEPPETETPEE